ncbi:MAG: cold-shock protein [Saprospirales bacterium]|jgi:CspA family cold shock protein|nr:MAG: cold-shock protein [Saprospirales bacterium]
MNKGVVKFFNDSKGFGFIQMEGQSNDIFVHVSGLIDDIRDNDIVLFEIKDGRRGPNAVNVKLAD